MTQKENGIAKYMDCCIAHIHQSDSENITNNHLDGLLTVYAYDEGYWILAPTEEENLVEILESHKITCGLKSVINKAWKLKVTWIKIDVDGFLHEDLATYQWK